MEAVCEAAGSTEYLPAVMLPVMVKDANGEAHTLSDAQYLEYQTVYLGFYWDTVERTLERAGNQPSKDSILAAAKSIAKGNATRRLFSAWASRAKPDEYKGIGGSALTQFKAGIDKANDDGSLTQEEVIDIIDQLNGLSDDQRSTLFHSHYESDKIIRGHNKKVRFVSIEPDFCCATLELYIERRQFVQWKTQYISKMVCWR